MTSLSPDHYDLGSFFDEIVEGGPRTLSAEEMDGVLYALLSYGQTRWCENLVAKCDNDRLEVKVALADSLLTRGEHEEALLALGDYAVSEVTAVRRTLLNHAILVQDQSRIRYECEDILRNGHLGLMDVCLQAYAHTKLGDPEDVVSSVEATSVLPHSLHLSILAYFWDEQRLDRLRYWTDRAMVVYPRSNQVIFWRDVSSFCDRSASQVSEDDFIRNIRYMLYALKSMNNMRVLQRRSPFPFRTHLKSMRFVTKSSVRLRSALEDLTVASS